MQLYLAFLINFFKKYRVFSFYRWKDESMKKIAVDAFLCGLKRENGALITAAGNRLLITDTVWWCFSGSVPFRSSKNPNAAPALVGWVKRLRRTKQHLTPNMFFSNYTCINRWFQVKLSVVDDVNKKKKIYILNIKKKHTHTNKTKH